MRRFLIGIISIIVLTAYSGAVKPTIKLRLDSAHLLMGNKMLLHAEVVKNRNEHGHFPIFNNVSATGIVGVNGDSVELDRNFKADTTDVGGGRIQINYHIPVQSFDSGFYYLPALSYVAGNDTVLSNRVALKVLPVNVKPDEDIAPLTDVAPPDSTAWYDSLPDVIVDYWWAFLAGLVLLAILIYLIIIYIRYGYKLRPEPEYLPPYDEAVKALNDLKSRKLWENGDEKGYFTELTDILRRYLSREFEIPAQEMTSSQLLDAIKGDEKLHTYTQNLNSLMSLADIVKFAKLRPTADDNIAAFDTVRDFVENSHAIVTENKETAASAESNNGKEVKDVL